MASAPEPTPIVVTPEMQDAAAAVLSEHYLGDGVYDLCDDVIAEVYRAMTEVRSKWELSLLHNRHKMVDSASHCERDSLPDVSAAFGDRGVAVYPGQSAADIMMIAGIIQRELDGVGHYVARDIARKILLAVKPKNERAY